jgi:hypothetical protein
MERDAMERARKEQTDKVEHEWRPGAEYVGRCHGGQAQAEQTRC